MQELPNLLTIKQFSKKYPAFPEGGLRHLIFYEKKGFSKCIRRVGRKVLIDEAEFFQWISAQNQSQPEQTDYKVIIK